MPRTEILYEKFAHGRDYVDLEMSFAPNGSSAVAATSIKGKGIYSVARTSAGLFTITFSSDYAALVAGDAHLQLATGDDKYAQLGTFTAATAAARATMTVRVWDASAAAETDVAANANNRINCFFTFRKGSIVP